MSGYQQNSSSSVNRVTPIVFTAWCLLSACTPTDIPVKSWTNAFEGIYSAAISHDGTRTFIGSSLHGGSVWNLSENERLYEWNHKQGEFSLITAAAISPDEQYIATVDGDTVVLWEAYSGRALQYFTAPADILSIALAPRGNFALLGLTNHSVVYFDIKNGGVIRTIQFDNSILSLALSDDGQLAIVGLSNSDAKLLDIKRELLLQDWHTKGWVKTVAISSNNRYVFIASQYRKATIRDINTGATISSLKVGTVFFRSFPANANVQVNMY